MLKVKQKFKGNKKSVHICHIQLYLHEVLTIWNKNKKFIYTHTLYKEERKNAWFRLPPDNLTKWIVHDDIEKERALSTQHKIYLHASPRIETMWTVYIAHVKKKTIRNTESIQTSFSQTPCVKGWPSLRVMAEIVASCIAGLQNLYRLNVISPTP